MVLRLAPASRLLLFALVSCFAVIACSLPNQPRGCDETIPEVIAPSLFEELTQDAAVQWARDNLEVSISDATTMDIQTEEGLEGKDFVGGRNGTMYTFRFLENELQSVLLYWERSAPAADRFIECFGTPDLYQATYHERHEDRWIYLELWYLDEGMRVSGRYFLRGNQPPSVDGTALLDAVTLVPPGTAEEMLASSMVGSQMNEEDRARFIGPLNPWPGSWEDAEVDDTPSLPEIP
jgi:hypothetical protein